MKLVPFTVHIRVVPARPGKRFEYLRDLQKLAVLAYDAIINISGVHTATPGGGQSQSMSDLNIRPGLGGFANGTAAKPQIGQNPAQLMLTGFYESAGKNIQPYADYTKFSGGEVYTGPGKHNNDAVPVAAVNTEVYTLRNALEAALTANLPDGAEYQIFRMEYSGIVYGDRGFHFPRS